MLPPSATAAAGLRPGGTQQNPSAAAEQLGSPVSAAAAVQQALSMAGGNGGPLAAALAAAVSAAPASLPFVGVPLLDPPPPPRPPQRLQLLRLAGEHCLQSHQWSVLTHGMPESALQQSRRLEATARCPRSTYLVLEEKPVLCNFTWLVSAGSSGAASLPLQQQQHLQQLANGLQLSPAMLQAAARAAAANGGLDQLNCMRSAGARP